ncbi:MAG: large-conductance mechanosensitive channel protein MscL [candidate division KSB1 bacterium]|nr:large-conductance mechanosensitive channel protein MscL [candidate division KSB1 bacterium]
MWKEFKEFAMRGNVLDMAVGIIIGAAFGRIVTSLVNDILMPPIGVVTGGIDFSDMALTIKSAPNPAEAVTIKYGVFINAVINFLIVAFAIFMLIRGVNRLKRKEEAPPPSPTTKECSFCLMSIPIKAMRCPHCTSELRAA